ncbi:hypothetical protein [Mycobacteroides abscessus]|uniref:hypothetical protein n=1 Tax=Mycobacteroides abscessus TaxID=36809 RepID=UPI0009259F28|nr:hypothetical protein [Mycobacteroides abscessus]SHZ19276.1 Uncharacterised protein [Mycobacteroides abscessus subsp. abscessus]SHZ36390.1 Uncharacterised protein [Mycobacteroides abscessus subsp. abscessus]SHZ68340.1 Uncharacterised protein [Mycobacteroides abscessus subsp. abscessus]SHZ81782.1 Uncharacterised protein [Mycobacteroides abscessus subsp. abscessus]SIA02238.1 Uncharacterised protein [Mycobacteroides abscessus subsp. abscessus]
MVTIPEVREWNLGELTNTATGLRSGAETLSDHALKVINGLKGITTDWEGESRDAYAVKALDLAGQKQKKAERWKNAAAVLDRAVQQMGLLRNAILDVVDSPDYQSKYAFADDGGVTLTDAYAKTLTSDQDKLDAETARADLQSRLRSLLATADVAGQQYDWQTTTALRGETDQSRPFVPRVPGPTKPGSGAKDDASKDGSGPDQYNVDQPDWWKRKRLQTIKLEAEMGTTVSRLGGDYAPTWLAHFLKGGGESMQVPVGAMLKDMPWFKQASDNTAKSAAATAIRAMPPGYTGPVAFQSEYINKVDDKPVRPDPAQNLDWFATLGTYSYQVSGVATPSDNGNYSVAAATSVYDYFNFDTTGRKLPGIPMPADLNDLHRAGMAQNFETYGTSNPYQVTYP